MRRRLKVLFASLVIVTLVFSSIGSVYAERGESKGKARNRNQSNIIIQQNFNNSEQDNNDDSQSDKSLFSDVSKDFWAYQSILDLVNRGVVKGYSDNTFKPNDSVTRAQFAIMLTRALNLKATDNTQKFADVPSSVWYYDQVEASANYLTGFMTSNGILNFYGDRNAVREDMAVALVKALNLAVVPDNGQLQQIFTDYNDISAKLRDYIYTAYVDGIMMGSNGKFAPQDTLTRASAATLLERALQKSEKVPPQDDGQKVVVGSGNPSNTVDTDATLSNLTVNGTQVSGFNSNTLTYNVTLPSGTTAVPAVAATVTDTGKATAVVSQAAALPGNSLVVVTAQDGKTQKVYNISFTVAAVVLDTDATLSNLTVNGTQVTGFNSNTLTYNVTLPAGTTVIPTVAAAVTDTGKASAIVTQAAALPGNSVVVVTAQDGKTQKIYTVCFALAPVVLDTDATLSNLTVSGTQVSGFNSNSLTYNVTLPAGTTVVPTVAATVTDTGKAAAVVTQAIALPGNSVVIVTAQDGKTQKLYTINFTVAPMSTDATLSALTVNGTTVAGFNTNTLTYNVVLPAGTVAVPTVSATVTDIGKATAILTQASGLPGSATVVVTAQDGKTQKAYIINFTVAQ